MSRSNSRFRVWSLDHALLAEWSRDWQKQEILQGLEVGDQVILSDMSASDGHDRVKLN